MQNQNETGPYVVPRVLGTRDGCRVGGGVGAFEASCGRLGWKGELEELVRGPSVQCFKKGWVVLSITDGKVLMKLSYTLRYSRQGQIMQRIHQILMFGSYLQR